MIWIIGKGGQLGTALAKTIPKDDFMITHESEVDICNIDEIKNYIKKHQPTLVINTSAYTAVEKAETEVNLAYKINYEGVKNLVQICNYNNIQLVHISTDFVFDGTQNIAYKESDKPNPLNIYGRSKLQGDNYILEHAKTALIFRTSWLYDSISSNFLTIMQKLGHEKNELNVVSDQLGTPTYVYDLVGAILQILPHIKIGVSELYNYSNEGVASWYDFAHAIMELSDIKCNVLPIKTGDYPTIATRPHFGILNKEK